MRFIHLAGCAAVLILGLAGCNQRQGGESASGLDGEWAVVAIRGDDVAFTPTEVQNMRWSVRGREIIGYGPYGSSGTMTFTLDQNKTPHEIDITAVDGNRKGETDAGIYALGEQRLRICLAEIGHGRPSEFRVGPESWIMELEKIRR